MCSSAVTINYFGNYWAACVDDYFAGTAFGPCLCSTCSESPLRIVIRNSGPSDVSMGFRSDSVRAVDGMRIHRWDPSSKNKFSECQHKPTELLASATHVLLHKFCLKKKKHTHNRWRLNFSHATHTQLTNKLFFPFYCDAFAVLLIFVTPRD